MFARRREVADGAEAIRGHPAGRNQFTEGPFELGREQPGERLQLVEKQSAARLQRFEDLLGPAPQLLTAASFRDRQQPSKILAEYKRQGNSAGHACRSLTFDAGWHRA